MEFLFALPEDCRLQSSGEAINLDTKPMLHAHICKVSTTHIPLEYILE